MLGRALIPLILKDGDKEVQVKEVEELKRLFNTENLPRLLSDLDSGKLEQFFFAKRLDHIKEKIAQMRQNGEDAIEILNYVAEQIGAGKFSLSFERASKRSLAENFTEEDQELYLILSSYSLTESSIKGNKKLIGALEEPNTARIEVNTGKLTGKNLSLKNVVLEFKGDFEFEAFESLSFQNVKFESRGRIVFANLKVKLKNCHFNTLVEFNNCEIDMQESTFSMSEIGGLSVLNSKGKFMRCKVFYSEVGEKSNDRLFYIRDSELNIEGTEVFRDNRASTTNGVVIENSSVSLKECRVYGLMHGIMALDSRLYISQSEIFENSTNLVIGSPEFEVKDSVIYKNGEEKLMQFCIINSKALIEGSKIHDSKGGIGIYLLSSKASIKDCEVFENLQGGIISINSSEANEIEPEVEIENCNIHNNHRESGAQVSIGNSIIKISNSNIHSSKTSAGIYISDSPKAILKNCKFFQNGGGGIFIRNSSNVKIEYCNAYANGLGSSSGGYTQIVIEASEVLIENSKVWMEKNSSRTGIGIEISDSPKVILKNCKVFQNGGNGMVIKNSSNVKIEHCDVYNNGSSLGLYGCPQIWIEASEVSMENSKVWMEISNGTNYSSTGIYIFASPKAVLYNCKIYQNDGNGIYIKDSHDVKIECCYIYDNGFSSSSVSSPQIYIEASKVLIENSKVWIETKNIFNNGISIKSGAVILYKVSTWGHRSYGVYADQSLAVALYECNIKEGVCQ